MEGGREGGEGTKGELRVWRRSVTLTVKVTCVFLPLQLRDELSLLSKEVLPIHFLKERMFPHCSHPWKGERERYYAMPCILIHVHNLTRCTRSTNKLAFVGQLNTPAFKLA